MTSQIKNFKDFTILYVEDEFSIRSSVESCLKYIFNVISAKNGEDGLEKFKTKNIDLIITDINMPIKNGISMMKDIKKISPNMPFIVTSAYADEENIEKVTKLGVYSYLLKPFDVRELVTNTMNALK